MDRGVELGQKVQGSNLASKVIGFLDFLGRGSNRAMHLRYFIKKKPCCVVSIVVDPFATSTGKTNNIDFLPGINKLN